jgi:hypothetical protein
MKGSAHTAAVKARHCAPVAELALIVIVLLFLIWIGAALWNVTGTGDAWNSIGGGPLAMDHQERARSGVAESAEEREQDLQSLLDARNDRRRAKGLPVDNADEAPADNASDESELAAEVRQHVLSRNERRIATGREPLDVEAEVARLLSES